MKSLLCPAIVLVGLAIMGQLAGCLTNCPEPSPVAERLHPIRPGAYVEVERDSLPDFARRPPWPHPWASELTVEVLSKDEVRIAYESNGRQVVEVYRVRGRTLHDNWSGVSFLPDSGS